MEAGNDYRRHDRKWNHISRNSKRVCNSNGIFKGDGEDLYDYRFDDDEWFHIRPVTFFCPCEDGYVIEVDGELED